MEKPLQIVVTGATGFIAKNLRKYLSKSNVHLFQYLEKISILSIMKQNSFKNVL